MTDIKGLTDKQIRLISNALDFYGRMQLGQFDEILNLPTFQKRIFDKDRNIDTREIELLLSIVKNKLYDNEDHRLGTSLKNGWGIGNPNLDESADIAYDLHQILRNHLWKQNENRRDYTVDSSVTLLKVKNKVAIE